MRRDGDSDPQRPWPRLAHHAIAPRPAHKRTAHRAIGYIRNQGYGVPLVFFHHGSHCHSCIHKALSFQRKGLPHRQPLQYPSHTTGSLVLAYWPGTLPFYALDVEVDASRGRRHRPRRLPPAFPCHRWPAIGPFQIWKLPSFRPALTSSTLVLSLGGHVVSHGHQVDRAFLHAPPGCCRWTRCLPAHPWWP